MSDAIKKIKVYCETTVIGDMASHPSPLIRNLARQMATREWWDAVCEQNGFKCPLIGTPEQLKEVYHGND